MKFEPVVILSAIKAVIAVLTGLGIVALDDATTEWILGAVGATLTAILTWATRKRVTPNARAYR